MIRQAANKTSKHKTTARNRKPVMSSAPSMFPAIPVPPSPPSLPRTRRVPLGGLRKKGRRLANIIEVPQRMSTPPSLLSFLFAAASAAVVVLVHVVDVDASDPFTLNGGSVMGMAGRGCVALAVDKRFASGPQMVNVSPRRVLPVHSRLLVGFAGLDGDVQSVLEDLSLRVASKSSREGGGGWLATTTSDSDGGASRGSPSPLISPRSMASLTSHVLYSRRGSPYYCEPLIVGLEPIPSNELDDSEEAPDAGTNNGPMRGNKKKRRYRSYICGLDMLGAQMLSTSFACCGAASQSMYGTAEAMWRPDMSPEELVRVCGRAFLSALERDCLSGYGAVIYLITAEGVEEFELVCRND